MSMRALHRHAPFGWIPLLVPLLAPLCALGQRNIYVNWAATGANDGSSWEDAFTDLQDAVALANDSSDCPCEIWIAAGTYKPDRGTGDPVLSFDLRNDIALYGGFAGWEADCDQRDSLANVTILSGDLNDDDLDDPNGDGDCCAANSVQHGCSDEACEAAVVAIRPGCLIHAWTAECVALANLFCCDLCRPSRCDNSGYIVSAQVYGTSITLDGLVIRRAELKWYMDGPGGAVKLTNAATVINSCVIESNAAVSGSAIDDLGLQLIVSHSVFVDNCGFHEGSWPTAAVMTRFSDPALFADCEFTHNSGSGLQCRDNAEIERCLFRNNGNSGLDLWTASALVTGSVFTGNSSVRGAAVYASNGVTQLVNCAFYDNHSTAGGAVEQINGWMSLYNCVLSGNTSLSQTGGVISDWGEIYLLNCTLTNNIGHTYLAGGLYNGEEGAAALFNCVLYDNVVENGDLQSQQLVNRGYMLLEYNSIEGWDGTLGGEWNADLPPMFVDADGADNVPGTPDDNLRLSADSPLINAGDPTPFAPYLDADGHARKLCGRLDIGAYEFGIGDYNCDRVFELADFAGWAGCVTGPAFSPYPPGCSAFDFNTEVAEDVDLRDFARLQNEIPSTWP